MKVLVIQQRMGIGDMIIFLPYIHAISKKFQSKVSLLVKKNSKADQLCLDDKHIEEIIFLDVNKNSSGKHNGFSGFFKLLSEIKKKNLIKYLFLIALLDFYCLQNYQELNLFFNIHYF